MKMKKLGLLLMLLCASFAMHAQELKKGDKFTGFSVEIISLWRCFICRFKG